jgi:predicted ATPase
MHRKIVLPGGPGGGKTTAADLFHLEMMDRVAVVPEAATLLFKGGFPRQAGETAARATQSAVFHVQRNLEDLVAHQHPERVLLCDRGTVDGAAYWPGPPDAFFESLGTTHEAELARYDAVLFFESAAAGGRVVLGNGNPFRTKSVHEAAALDARLQALWSRHPNFVHLPNEPSFFSKVERGFRALERIFGALSA